MTADRDGNAGRGGTDFTQTETPPRRHRQQIARDGPADKNAIGQWRIKTRGEHAIVAEKFNFPAFIERINQPAPDSRRRIGRYYSGTTAILTQ